MGDAPDQIGEGAAKEPIEKADAGPLPILAGFSGLLFTRKNRRWIGDREGATSRQVGWIAFLAEICASSRTLLFNLLVLLVTCAFLLMLGMEISRKAVTLFPVSVPEKLSKNGYTPDVVAARISAELKRITREAETAKERSDFVERHAEIEFQLPGQLVSFRTLVRFVRGLLGAENTEVQIDVAEDQSSYMAQIRVYGGAYDGSLRSATAPVSVQFDSFIIELSRAVMLATGPYMLASYEMTREDASCKSTSRCDYSKAIAILSEITAKPSHPDYKWGLLGHSKLFINLNRFEEAIKNAQKATEFDPKFALAYYNWGAALRNSNREEEAIEKYKKVLELNPEYIFAYYNWGVALQYVNRSEEAIEKYRKALELGPKDADIYNSWGNALQYLYRYEEAIDKYKTALELNPGHVNAHANWGLALENLKRYGEAIEKYKRALELDAEFVFARDRLKLATAKGARQ